MWWVGMRKNGGDKGKYTDDTGKRTTIWLTDDYFSSPSQSSTYFVWTFSNLLGDEG